MHFHSVLTALLLTATTAAAQSQQARPAAPTPAGGDTASGKKLYEAYSCYACHGFNGETGARALVGSRSQNLATESNFIAFLRGRANVAPLQPSTSMPNYSATTLSDAQARDIYAHIRTFKSNAPPADQIPVFNEILKGAQRPYKK